MPRRITLDPGRPDPEPIGVAAQWLRAGRLVAFPTETVYGLGADASQPDALLGIFTAKGRPRSNPLILHVHEIALARSLVSSWPEVADRLAERFWPGPLTLILPRSDRVPDEATGGGPTVALRMPDSPIALALLGALGQPIAAPSANRSGAISPTRADHVATSLGDQVDLILILDGGPTRVGIESTVLDLTSTPPRILRPGSITPAMLQDLIGPIEISQQTHSSTISPALSPGQSERHYAPTTPCYLINVNDLMTRAWTDNEAVLGFGPHPEQAIFGPARVRWFDSPDEAHHNLYHLLHRWDRCSLETIWVVVPDQPVGKEWQALMNRIQRAAIKLPLSQC